MSYIDKINEIHQMRRKLRLDLIQKMKSNPTLADSETLRKVENDISFWENQTDRSVSGMMKTLSNSFNELE